MNSSPFRSDFAVSGQRAAFTLLEMITVISVIAILTSLIAPAITSLGRSTGLVTGGNLLANVVSYARQEAVSRNTMTALLVLAQQGSADDYSVFTVLEYNAMSGWRQIDEWKKLPAGIVFDPDPVNSTFLENSPSFPLLATTHQDNPPVRYHSTKGAESEAIKNPTGYAARIFLPSGGLQNPEDPAQLVLVEGFIQSGKLVRTRRSGTSSSNYYEVAILGPTGLTKVSRP